MGLIWWLYSGSPASLGGMKGTPSHWRVVNVNIGDLSQDPVQKVRDLPAPNQQQVVDQILAAHPELEVKVNPDHIEGKIITIGDLVDADPALLSEYKLTPNDLGGLEPVADVQRGSSATRRPSPTPRRSPPKGRRSSPTARRTRCSARSTSAARRTSTSCLRTLRSGTGSGRTSRSTVHITHPEHFIVVQVQAVVPQVTPPGGKPPTPQIDPTQPVISVVMIRSLGDVRFPGFMTFLVSGILFAILCNTLHRRDKLIARNRASGNVGTAPWTSTCRSSSCWCSPSCSAS